MIPFAVLHYYGFDSMGGDINMIRYLCGEVVVVEFEDESYYEGCDVYYQRYYHLR